MPKLPAAQTFVSPGYGSDGSCGSATTDGMGTVYSVENGRGGGIYSNAGGIVKSENLFVPLASGFSTFPQGMMATGTISVRGPDGTLASLGSFVSDRYVTVFAGEQANGGSVIVAVNPGVDCSKTNDLQIIRFDDHFAKTSDVHVLNRGCTPGYGSEENDILVDAQDRTLMVYVAQGGDIHGVPAGHYGAGWFDPAGKALTDWFDAGASHQGSLLVGPVLVPLIGGGAALRSASGWVTVPSGAARIDPAPAGFTPGKIPHIVLGGRAYAMTDLRSLSADQSPSTVEIVEPGGASCGVLTTAPTTGEYFTIGKDGTLLTVANTAGASGRLDMCTTTYYPRVLE